ncbi:DUF3050 domain-containing protein [Pleionea sediminis]|uniref:DUF3050 domain-containing protein n=1 Tax=Pleionea sediminis TaxID=2569479 RepID=UPI00118635F8|nr:DUF3050 domain-containing protein [Pleionea sediminis]
MLNFKTESIKALNQQLVSHPLYCSIYSLDDMSLFMQHHVFAVWDFMSLLKALQVKLTNVSVPWYPVGDPAVRKMINEIVLGEESDEVVGGLSHFEWYIQAMKECDADTSAIDMLLEAVMSGDDYHSVISSLPPSVEQFVNTTLDIVENGELHEIAAAFTIGRENLIPSMFVELVRNINRDHPDNTYTLIRYFERHIEVDGDEHGPLATQMLTRLCDNSNAKYQDCLDTAERVLQSRIDLWNGVYAELININEMSQIA